MANGDASLMSAIWAHNKDVTALHPIGERNEGWGETRSTFEQVGSIASGGQIRLRGQLIQVGTDLAYEVGTEEGEITLAGERVSISHRVTNVYRRGDGAWKMVHHHTDLSPTMIDLLSRLQASAS
ncbi:MAG TPA: nuclear transport factor 2 family protein [Thermomicrobiales bacterium]|nr:nuclear transport factor 2 family protein [Thermomicrobiales bacterium]